MCWLQRICIPTQLYRSIESDSQNDIHYIYSAPLEVVFPSVRAKLCYSVEL